jgi:fucose permease
VIKTKFQFCLYGLYYLVFLVCLFLYFGVLAAFSGWLVTYWQYHVGQSRITSVAVTGAYWLAFSIGRFLDFILAPIMLRPHVFLLVGGLGGVASSVVSLLLSAVFNKHVVWVSGLVAVGLGFSTGLIYPAMFIVNYMELQTSTSPGVLAGIYRSLWRVSAALGGSFFSLAVGYSLNEAMVVQWDVMLWLGAVGFALLLALFLCIFIIDWVDALVRQALRKAVRKARMEARVRGGRGEEEEPLIYLATRG